VAGSRGLLLLTKFKVFKKYNILVSTISHILRITGTHTLLSSCELLLTWRFSCLGRLSPAIYVEIRKIFACKTLVIISIRGRGVRVRVRGSGLFGLVATSPFLSRSCLLCMRKFAIPFGFAAPAASASLSSLLALPTFDFQTWSIDFFLKRIYHIPYSAIFWHVFCGMRTSREIESWHSKTGKRNYAGPNKNFSMQERLKSGNPRMQSTNYECSGFFKTI